jgi:hypothetical protein
MDAAEVAAFWEYLAAHNREIDRQNRQARRGR